MPVFRPAPVVETDWRDYARARSVSVARLGDDFARRAPVRSQSVGPSPYLSLTPRRSLPPSPLPTLREGLESEVFGRPQRRGPRVVVYRRPAGNYYGRMMRRRAEMRARPFMDLEPEVLGGESSGALVPVRRGSGRYWSIVGSVNAPLLPRVDFLFFWLVSFLLLLLPSLLFSSSSCSSSDVFLLLLAPLSLTSWRDRSFPFPWKAAELQSPARCNVRPPALPAFLSSLLLPPLLSLAPLLLSTSSPPHVPPPPLFTILTSSIIQMDISVSFDHSNVCDNGLISQNVPECPVPLTTSMSAPVTLPPFSPKIANAPVPLDSVHLTPIDLSENARAYF